MLAGIKFVDRSEADKALEEERKALNKQKKKDKKDKKKRKQKEQKNAPLGGKSDSGSDSEAASPSHAPAAATEAASPAAASASAAAAAAAASNVQREDWMTKSFPKAAANADAVPLPGAKPAEKKMPDPQAKLSGPQEGLIRVAGEPQGKVTSSRVGDGGASWRLKALARAKQQATDESNPNFGRRVGDIVSDQWGSLAELTAGLTDTRAAHAKAHLLAAKERQAAAAQAEDSARGASDARLSDRPARGGASDARTSDRSARVGASDARMSDRSARVGASDARMSDRQDRIDAAHYLQDVKSSRSQMRRPAESGSLSWRRSTGAPQSQHNQPRISDTDRPDSAREKLHRRDSSAEPRDREGDSHREGDTRSDRLGDSQRDSQRDRARASDHDTDRRTDRDRDQNVRRDRDGARGSTHDIDRRTYRVRDNSRVSDRDTSRRTDKDTDQKGARSRVSNQRGLNPNSKQAELLASVASEMNAFSNDGSFMDKFQALQTSQQTSEEEEVHSQASSDSDSRQGLPERPQSSDAEGGRAVPRGPSGGNQGAAAALRARISNAQAAPAGEDNKSTAAALRARLMGVKQPTLVLGPQSDVIQASAAESTSVGESRGAESRKAGSVQLSALDSKGRAVPGAFGRAAVGQGAPEGGRKPKRVQRFDEGERQRYFADDDKQQLGDLIAEQRYEGAADIDANLADNIMRKGKRFREKELDVDEEYDVDGGLDMYESRKKKGTKEQQVKRDRSAQIAEHRRTSNALDRCNLCFGSAARARHLTVSLGQTAYLAIPARGRLVEGHCIIVPTEHIASTRQVDDHVWTELRNFKKCLLQMHMAEGSDVIFIETAMRLGDARSHAVVHCIPVPPAIAAKAPLYFKKGIDDAESEWSQHHAKRMIETGGKGLRGSIPANFPYFHVEFNLTKGFVHVIDDESKFDANFGRSILIGLLGLLEEDMHRRAKTDSNQAQQQWVLDLAKKWDAYDWTKQLA